MITLIDELLTHPSNWSTTRFRVSPEFEWLRGDPEFESVLDKHGLGPQGAVTSD